MPPFWGIKKSQKTLKTEDKEFFFNDQTKVLDKGGVKMVFISKSFLNLTLCLLYS